MRFLGASGNARMCLYVYICSSSLKPDFEFVSFKNSVHSVVSNCKTHTHTLNPTGKKKREEEKFLPYRKSRVCASVSAKAYKTATTEAATAVTAAAVVALVALEKHLILFHSKNDNDDTHTHINTHSHSIYLSIHDILLVSKILCIYTLSMVFFVLQGRFSFRI